MRIAYKVIVKTKPHGRYRRRCENIIKTNIKEAEKFKWICMAQDKGRWWAVVSKEMNLAPIKTYVFLEQVNGRQLVKD